MLNKDIMAQPSKLRYGIFKKYEFQEENVSDETYADVADVRLSIVGDDDYDRYGIGIRRLARNYQDEDKDKEV